MTQQKQTDSKHASIHEIVNQNKKRLRKIQINQLFQTPNLSQFDTLQFQHHPFMISNDMFTFFVHQLQKWNQKIRNKQITPFYHAELNRNMFVYSSLKIISLKKVNQVARFLEELTKWYSKNSYNIPQPCVLMKKYNPNQEWEIRKTFRSNTPSEINNYRRRFLCSPDTTKDPSFGQNFFRVDNKKQNCFFENKLTTSKNYKAYKTCEDHSSQGNRQSTDLFKQIIKNKQGTFMRIKNREIRKQRQQQQINNAQNYWKKSHSRFGQKTSQNFLKGKFYNNKQFINQSNIQPRKIQTAACNNRYSQQSSNLIMRIKKDRLKTSLGVRKNYKHQADLELGVQIQNFGQKKKLKTQENQESKQNFTNWIDSYIVDEDKINLRNRTFENGSVGRRLISNPFQMNKGKIKKKKK